MRDAALIRERILARLDGLPAELQPVRHAAARYLDFRCSMDGTDDCAAIAHSPWLGVLSHTFRIYPAIKPAELAQYETLHGIDVPAIWRRVMLGANGLEAFGLTLFGMPASMLNDPPLLNRAAIQCLDIGLANADWKYEYEVDPSYFHVGARDYSDTELVGYFINGKGTIVGVRQNGGRVGEWPRVDAWLSEELKAAEKLFLTDAPKDWKPKPK